MAVTAIYLALAGWLTVAVSLDLRHRQIPNSLLLGLFVPALLHLLIKGTGMLHAGYFHSVLGMILAGLLLLPGFALGLLGAGDVKFVAVLGLLLGSAGAAEMVIIGSVGLGLISLWFFAKQGEAGRRVPRRIPASPPFAAAFVLQLAGVRFFE